MSVLRKPEVLSPAGSPEALQAAIAAGADAVYFGLGDFNARIRATNFQLGDLPDVVRDLRRWGVRSCLTFNTLVFRHEEQTARDLLEAIAIAGPDALIVQDLGVIRWAREIAPNVEVHASTQMTIASPDAVALVARMGATRVVLARELTLPEIARVRAASDVELEIFVHGALCVSYSGQCLSSEAWGGRSANRGQCAQACRHPYDLMVDGLEREMGDRAYLLSPRDLEGFHRIADLTKIGIAAFKIEGRMKGPEYVAAATSLYRAEVDRIWKAIELGRAESISAPSRAVEQLATRARQTYSRGASEGFLGGVNHQVLVDGRTRSHRGLRLGTIVEVVPGPGGRLIGVVIESDDHGTAAAAAAAGLRAGDGLLIALSSHEQDEIGGGVFEASRESAAGRWRIVFARESMPDLSRARAGAEVFRTASPAVSAELKRFLQSPEQMRRVPLQVTVKGALGALLTIHATDPEGRTAEAFSTEPLHPADRSPLDATTLRDQLSRLGGTRYTLETLDVALTDLVFVPVSELNRMRRDLVAQLEELRGRASEAKPKDSSTTDSQSATALPEQSGVIDWAIARAEATSADAPTHPTVGVHPSPAQTPDSFAQRFVVLCRQRAQVDAALASGVTRIALDFLDLVGLKDAATDVRAAGARLTLALPRVQKPGEEKTEMFFIGRRPDEVLVRSLGSLERLRILREQHVGAFPDLIGDVSLNVVNPSSFATLRGLGLARVTPGLDLNGDQLIDLVDQLQANALEIPLHHRLPVFHTEHCVFAAFLSDGADYRTCGRPCDHHAIELRDRTGQRHPVIADVGCRNTVFSGKPQSALPHLASFRRAGVHTFRLELALEDPATTSRIVALYRDVWEGQVAWQSALADLRADGRWGVSTGSPEPPRTLSTKPVGGRRDSLTRSRRNR